MRGEKQSIGFNFKVWNILWETDGEDVELPLELEVVVPEDLYACDEEEEYISNWLTDEYGFCHNGFMYKEI